MQLLFFSGLVGALGSLYITLWAMTKITAPYSPIIILFFAGIFMILFFSTISWMGFEGTRSRGRKGRR
jgi:hypothetical protein